MAHEPNDAPQPPPDADSVYPTTATREELDAGFVVTTIPNPSPYGAPSFFPQPPTTIPAVVRELPDGLQAVKMVSAITKGIIYAIRRPAKSTGAAQNAASSLQELLERFPL